MAANEVVREIQTLGQKSIAFQLDTSNINNFSSFVSTLSNYLQSEYGKGNFDF